MDGWAIQGPAKWSEAPSVPSETDALYGLLNLGYDEAEARELLQKAKASAGASAPAETLIKAALKMMGGKIS
jgi:Holliday junction resolvasome RuvABC DNA-binding subunit